MSPSRSSSPPQTIDGFLPTGNETKARAGGSDRQAMSATLCRPLARCRWRNFSQVKRALKSVLPVRTNLALTPRAPMPAWYSSGFVNATEPHWIIELRSTAKQHCSATYQERRVWGLDLPAGYAFSESARILRGQTPWDSRCSAQVQRP